MDYTWKETNCKDRRQLYRFDMQNACNMIDWLLTIVVKSRRNVLDRDYCYVTDIIKDRETLQITFDE